TEAAAIDGLAVGGRCKRERVLPAEAIPIGDVEGERQYVAPALRELVQIGIGRRAGRATLRGEEFDDDRPISGMGHDRQEACEQYGRENKAREHGDPPWVRQAL